MGWGWNKVKNAGSVISGGLSGGLAGAGVGSIFGPWGAVAGAGIGLVLGGLAGWQQGQIDEEMLRIEEKRLGLDTEQMRLALVNQIYSVDKDIAGLEADREDILTDITEAKSNISSYQGWLDNYASMYEAETSAAKTQIAELEASGKQAYEGLMSNMGMTDALAGATGRAGAGTSMAGVAQKQRQNVTDYVGADMALDMNGGLYGMQRASAQLNYGQLELDLKNQLEQAKGNLENWNTALYGGVVEGQQRSGFLSSLASQEEAIQKAKTQRDSFQAWADAYIT
jgi:hypothetical protein